MGKSFFGQKELEYLDYWITREGIMPLPNKVSAIHEIEPPKNKKQLGRVIGIINFYRYMWKRRAEKLAPLTVLTSKKSKCKWTEVEQQAFEAVKTATAKITHWYTKNSMRSLKFTLMQANISWVQ
eukprot:12564443-Ditylum_brightwellii.AAC.1